MYRIPDGLFPIVALIDEAIAERLDLFDRVADVARILDQGNAATSHPDFGAVLRAPKKGSIAIQHKKGYHRGIGRAI